jgi:hypothetical protein
MHETLVWRRFAAALLLGAALTCCGCAGTGGRKAKLELVQFVTRLSGVYDNRAQAAARPEVGEVQVSIQPAYAPALGKQVFYVHETAASDDRRLVSQRLVAVELGPKGNVVQHDWVFVDALRWRTAREQPDLFKSLILDDVRATAPRKLELTGDELTFQIIPGQDATALRLQRQAR